jgi:hypothetical protein
MRRRYVLVALAAVAALSVAMPAFGAPSPLTTAKRALSSAKKATRTAKTANRRALRAQTAANQALALINGATGVPKAVAADTATNATNATNAANATNATTAATANALAGFKKAGKLVRAGATEGADVAAARAAAPEQPLGSSGPFTVYGKCLRDNSVPEVIAEVYARTSESGALLDGQDDLLDGSPAFLNTDTPEEERQIDTQSEAADASSVIEFDDDISTLVSAGLDTVEVHALLAAKRGTLAAGNGPFGDGDSCLFGATVLG